MCPQTGGEGRADAAASVEEQQVGNSSFLWYHRSEDTAPALPVDVQVVQSYLALFWYDFELHWIWITELKLLFDIFVATSVVREWKAWKGPVATMGLLSGMLSVYRVWTYGR